MADKKPFDVMEGAAGCLTGVMAGRLLTRVFMLVPAEWLGGITVKDERVVTFFTWHASVCFSGYWSARQLLKNARRDVSRTGS